MDWERVVILSFSIDPWGGPRMGRHNLMHEFAKCSLVYYCNRIWLPKESLQFAQGKGKIKTGWCAVNKNLFEFVPSLSIFSTYRYKKINKFQYNRYRKAVTKKLTGKVYDYLLLYIWHPAFDWVTEVFPADLVIYHMYDDYASYSDMTIAQKKQIYDREKYIISKSDLVFATHPTLLKKEYNIEEKGRIVGNAVDYELFSKEYTMPQDISVLCNVKRERGLLAGYVGRITSKLDFHLLCQLAETIENLTLVLVGPTTGITNQDNRLVEKLAARPNVNFLGEKKVEELPGYIQALDITLLPYKVDGSAHIHAIYPLKLHEYFACGKPVLATRFNQYMEKLFPDEICWGGLKEWITVLTMNNRMQFLLQGRDKRIRIAERNSWSQRVMMVQQYIEQIIDQSGTTK